MSDANNRTMRWPAELTLPALLLAALAIQATTLLLMGQPPICTCGIVRLWTGAIFGPENSQQLTDWYTPSHVIHGLLLYGATRLLMPRLPITAALALTLCVEVGWEIVENSPPTIRRYRQQALASGYSGDSVINSLSDTLACILGFFLARALPTKATVGLGVALELFTGFMVRDNLTLNTLQLIHPVEAIAVWQKAGQKAPAALP